MSSGGYEATVYSLAVSPGGDVYAGGTNGSAAMVWKNGAEHWRLTETGQDTAAFSLAVGPSGTLYAGGREKNQQGNQRATLWWQGADGSVKKHYYSYANSIVTSIAVCPHGDVYAGGWEGSQLTVWMNDDVLWRLTEDAGVNSSVNSIFVR
jgi:WD40 repeat protein